MKYLDELLQSNVRVDWNTWERFQNSNSGLYMLYPNFDLEKISNEKYLKVGMTISEKGLKGRLSTHFNSRVKFVKDKLKGPTVLGRHMYLDRTLSEQFGLDFTIQQDRQNFLRKNCYFKVLPLNHFNWVDEYEKKEKRRELKKIESSIEYSLRNQIRYIDKVIYR